ncbi:MAG: MotA/TolQ/ExbB proton channel family protein [bacterium]|nr:MotA/TolQ/ExbB proton channel family protein [bacterium]
MYSLIVKGGIIMIPIIIGSVFALTILIERIIYFIRVKRFTPVFSAQIKRALNNKDINSAIELCRQNENEPMANIILAGLMNINSGKDSVKTAIIEAGDYELPKLEQYLNILGIIANVEPLLGLLGTVTGMIRAFSVIAQQGLVYSPGLAGGISEALITTAAGLFIGIPCLIANHYLLNIADNIALGMEKESTEILKMITK